MSVTIIMYPIDKPIINQSQIIGGTQFEINDEYHGILIPSDYCSGNWEIQMENSTLLIPRTCNI